MFGVGEAGQDAGDVFVVGVGEFADFVGDVVGHTHRETLRHTQHHTGRAHSGWVWPIEIVHTIGAMRRFEVHDRNEDVLAEGIEFSDGTAAIQDEHGNVVALTGPHSHGLDGHLVWLDNSREASYLHARERAEQAEAERDRLVGILRDIDSVLVDLRAHTDPSWTEPALNQAITRLRAALGQPVDPPGRPPT